MNKSEKKKSLHQENLHTNGHNVKYYDLSNNYLFIGMVRKEGLKFLRGWEIQVDQCELSSGSKKLP